MIFSHTARIEVVLDSARYEDPASSFGISRLCLVTLLLLLFSPVLKAESGKTNFFLPQNPTAAAYVLGRLSNQELTEAPRSEFVYVALLQRSGLERKYRLEGLEGLAKLRHTDPLTELLAVLMELDKKGEDSAGSVLDLSQILLQSPPETLALKRSILQKLAMESQLPLTRQVGFAALATAENSAEQVWKQAASTQAQLVDLMLGIPLIRDAQLRASFYSLVQPFLPKPTPQPTEPPVDAQALGRAALMAIVAIPGHETETFKTLAALIEAGTERSTALASIQRIPKKNWPQDAVGALVKSLVAYLQSVPTSERTQTEFTDALGFATQAAALLPEEQAKAFTKTLRGLGPAIFVLRAVYEQMRYDQQSLVVAMGKPVVITLENEDAMPHNLAILMPGALEEIGNAAEKMPSEPDAEGRLYVPASPKVLHATKLVPPAQKTQLAFTAPAEPGEYQYVCTFPGHWRRMTGIMYVVEDVEAWLASHAQSEAPKVTEWKLSDLAPELSKVGFGRNLENGQKLFTQLACIQCHKLGTQGYAFGPDLTDLLVRYKDDRTNILQQILEPSKIVEERYRNFDFDLKNADPVTGIILKEDPESVTIQTGPADSLIQTFKKSDIEGRHPKPSSPMPLGLLNALSKEQILDLLAYVETKGDLRAQGHKHEGK
jgi:putative heme-binding domain-containing protein